MTTQEVADRLVDLCRKGDYETCLKELYSPNAISVEPDGSSWETAEGIDAIVQKGEQFNAMVEEMHGGSVGDPIVAGNHFSCTMSMDVTFKGMGRQQMEEICVYEVQDGKIVAERFFFPVQPQA